MIRDENYFQSSLSAIFLAFVIFIHSSIHPFDHFEINSKFLRPLKIEKSAY